MKREGSWLPPLSLRRVINSGSDEGGEKKRRCPKPNAGASNAAGLLEFFKDKAEMDKADKDARLKFDKERLAKDDERREEERKDRLQQQKEDRDLERRKLDLEEKKLEERREERQQHQAAEADARKSTQDMCKHQMDVMMELCPKLSGEEVMVLLSCSSR